MGKFPFRALAIMALITTLYVVFKEPEAIQVKGNSEVKITAEDIERILEIASASQKVYVETDTLFSTKSIKTLFGVKLKFMDKAIETIENHRLKERRTWVFKAGSKHFDLKQTGSGYRLEVDAPLILSREHLTEEYKEIERVGVWNPVTMQQIEIASRNRAQAQAIKEGLLIEARLSLENNLMKLLPNNVNIHINE